jgi:heme oxygenase (mycobilin-producing)
MNVFMTSGTLEFMERLREKHASEKMFILHGEGNVLLLHETNGKTVFQTPRRYEVLGSAGNFEENGFFVFYNIPVSDEGRPVFEHNFKERANAFDAEPGFIAFRLLRPHKSDTYIILMEWSDNRYYTLWKTTSSFEQNHLTDPVEAGANSVVNLFSGAPSITTYMSKEKNEDA